MAGNILALQARTNALKRMPQRVQAAFEETRQEAHAWAIDAHGEFVDSHLHGSPVRRITGQLERSFQPVWSTSRASFKAGVAFAPTMTDASGTFANYANIYAGIITCGATVTVLNYFSAWLQKKFTTWR